MPERGLVGYQIGLQSHVSPLNRILFVTNGIFLQRIVHGTAFF
jgi:HrpA-like RNA helicase